MPRHFNRPHIVWGWSGTLADDVPLQVAAVNAALAALGAPPVDLDTIRHRFATSPPALCAAILGRPLTDRERARASLVFETHPARRRLTGLLPGTEELLARLIRSGCSHSVLSLGAHRRLTQHIAELGADSFFLRIDGRTGPSARSKTQPLAKHLSALRQTVGDRPVALIGDAVDDIRAAVANQVQPVPYAGGLTHRDVLRRSGVPVADNLAEAAALAVEYAHTT
ncbi:HAD family hydrolase [Streptomyces sp. NPDC051572]|uniref:HAD family hydrolase n=1 Tax=Streptomyces sp. NPDC051572 TaxID=3155802 RepID=UPI00344C90DE